MKNKKNGILYKIITISLLLLMTATIVVMPETNALNIDLYAYITVTPNPIGVGQQVTATFWLDRPSPTAVAGYDPIKNWGNLTVKITSPNGNTETLGPFAADATGGNICTYTPKSVGDYKFEFTFPGQTFGNDYYKPASATTNLTVQEEPIMRYQTNPLPSDYWNSPVFGEDKGWNTISGGWLMPGYNATGAFEPGDFNPYTTAPNTAHVVWTKETHLGGVAGGDRGDYTFYMGPTYQYYWTPLAIGGNLYFPQRLVPGDAWDGLYCYDIATGEENWYQPMSKGYSAGSGGGGTIPTMVAQLLQYDGPNAHGVLPYLWTTGVNYTMIDANSGEPILTAIGAPATSYLGHIGQVTGPLMMYDEIGSLLAYYIDPVRNQLFLWNSTKLVERAVGSTNIYSPPVGAKLNWTTGIEWNVTVPRRDGAAFNLGYPASTGDVIFAYSANIATGGGYQNFTLVAYNKNTGQELWFKNITDPLSPSGSQPYLFFGPSRDGVLTIYRRQSMQWYAFDANTGNQLWGPTEPYTNAWDQYAYGNIAYGNMYVCTYSGRVYCHNLTTGELTWTFETPPSGFETPYGNWPFGVQYPMIADGKIFVGTAEHTPNSPFYTGSKLYCVNASNGQGIWNMSGWWSIYYAGVSPIAVNGYLLSHNWGNGEIFCFGKGQTATTVSAPDVALNFGQAMTIKGYVTDQSPGAPGTPAIADKDQSAWMEYLYLQKQKPTNATGVPVDLSVVDANGNYRNIGTTTSDADGFFSMDWIPDIPGKYTLYASFAGSEAYWSSHAVTAFTVQDEPSATAQPTPLPISVADTYFIPSVIGIIVAIFLVGAVLALLIRKKP
ncbi:MAG: PQQ-binding-like beta-propeller repeat protein [Candidatus Bathyarchaeia archaeon]|jgi:outer membrane protein assembly factor BamB